MTPLQKLVEESMTAQDRAHGAIQRQIDSLASCNGSWPDEEYVKHNYTLVLASYIAEAANAKRRLREKQQDDDATLFVERMWDKAQSSTSENFIEISRSDLFRLAGIAQAKTVRMTDTEKS